MTFLEAKKAASDLAQGNYHHLTYELTMFEAGKTRARCVVFICHGDETINVSADGPNWDTALGEIRKRLGCNADLAEAPKGEADNV